MGEFDIFENGPSSTLICMICRISKDCKHVHMTLLETINGMALYADREEEKEEKDHDDPLLSLS